MFFAAGFATLLQISIGSRLPILQGASFTFVTPAIALLSTERYKCVTQAAGKYNEDIFLERIQALQVKD